MLDGPPVENLQIMKRNPIPVRHEFVGRGAMGTLNRFFYDDQSTRLKKTSNELKYNKDLKNEYTILLILGGKRNESIPEVYNEYPVINKDRDLFAFEIEDLKDFHPIFGDGKDLTTSLDTDDKVFITGALARCLRFVNNEGFLHNDVAVANIMYDGSNTKLVDWANAKKMEHLNDMTDVRQAKQFLLQLYKGEEFIPETIRPWLTTEFTNPKIAWDDLEHGVSKCIGTGTGKVETLRRDVFGKRKFP